MDFLVEKNEVGQKYGDASGHFSVNSNSNDSSSMKLLQDYGTDLDQNLDLQKLIQTFRWTDESWF